MTENPFYNQSGFTQSSNTQVSNKKQELDISHFAGLNLTENRLNDSYGRQTVNPTQFASPLLYQGNLDPTTPQKKSCCGSCNGGKGCDGGADGKGCSGGCGGEKEKGKVNGTNYFQGITNQQTASSQNFQQTIEYNYNEIYKDNEIQNVWTPCQSLSNLYKVERKYGTLKEVKCKTKYDEKNNQIVDENGNYNLKLILKNTIFVNIKINILDCCSKHKKKLFCAKNTTEIINADNELINCISNQIKVEGEKAIIEYLKSHPLANKDILVSLLDNEIDKIFSEKKQELFRN